MIFQETEEERLRKEEKWEAQEDKKGRREREKGEGKGEVAQEY